MPSPSPTEEHLRRCWAAAAAFTANGVAEAKHPVTASAATQRGGGGGSGGGSAASSARVPDGAALALAQGPVSAGTVLCSVPPFTLIQDPFGVGNTLCCTQCAGPCAPASVVVDLLSGAATRAQAAEAACAAGAEQCSRGCGALYCSAQCRVRADALHHRFLCVGLIEDEAHPLYQFKLWALSSGVYEQLQLAAQVVGFFAAAAAEHGELAGAVGGGKAHPDDGAAAAAAPGCGTSASGRALFAATLARFHPLFAADSAAVWHRAPPPSSPPFASATALPLPVAEDGGEEQSTETVFQRAYALLRAGFLREHGLDFASLLGGRLDAEFFGVVCGDIQRWAVPVRLPSPLVAYCEALGDEGGAGDQEALAHEVERLRRVLQRHGDDDSDGDGDSGEEGYGVEEDNEDEEEVGEEAGGGSSGEGGSGKSLAGNTGHSGRGADGGAADEDENGGEEEDSDSDEDYTDDDEASDDEERDGGTRSSWRGVTLDDLVCDARKRFDEVGAFEGLALFLPLRTLRHSCDPSGEVKCSLSAAAGAKPGCGGGCGGVVASLVATDDLAAGAELTLCHTPGGPDGDEPARAVAVAELLLAAGTPAELLQHIDTAASGCSRDGGDGDAGTGGRDVAARCGCSKCRVQRGALEAVADVDLRGLLRRDLRRNALADATVVLDELASRSEQRSVEDLYMRARVAGWDGRWRAADLLWEEALRRFPGHPTFALVEKRRRCYSHPSLSDAPLLPEAEADSGGGAAPAAATFKVNDYVAARWQGEWKQGRVACFWEEDGVYNVLGPAGERMFAIEAADIRPLRPLAVGDAVDAVEGTMWGKSAFVRGEVVGTRPPNAQCAQLYDVRFATSGETEELVDRALIRRPPRPAVDATVCSRGRSIFLHTEPVLSPDECDGIVAETERIASVNGWGTTRHYAVPTTDIPMADLPGSFPFFKERLFQRVFPELGVLFDVDPSRLRVLDVFVVKYDAASGRRHLGVHSDQSTHSFVISLSSAEAGDFEGGGTYFVDTHGTKNPEKGRMVSFHGSLYHAGRPVTKGTRYIIAAFLYLLE